MYFVLRQNTFSLMKTIALVTISFTVLCELGTFVIYSNYDCKSIYDRKLILTFTYLPFKIKPRPFI